MLRFELCSDSPFFRSQRSSVDQKFASFLRIRVEMVGIDDVMKMGVRRILWRDKSQYLF